MVYINSIIVPCASRQAPLTVSGALSLAESAFKAGRIQTAQCYVDIVYAMLDARFGKVGADANASPNDG